MISFLQYLMREANSAGSTFEQKIARNVNAWIKQNKLDDMFEAKRFQTVTESDDDDGRNEDYSDVVVTNLKTGDEFFIECKEITKANIITTQFDINEEFYPVAVKDEARFEMNDDLHAQLAQDIFNNVDYQNFISFLKTPISELDNSSPSEYFFNLKTADSNLINKLISKYNQLVDDEKVESDCKKFDKNVLRDTTTNMLVCALCWRILDTTRTWDICHVVDIPYFGNLIKQHYMQEKAMPAKYLQLQNDLFVFSSNDNPLHASIDEFPSNITGRFDLKFTPRFGSGAMYITPRSQITSQLQSTSTFSDKDRYPSILKQ